MIRAATWASAVAFAIGAALGMDALTIAAGCLALALAGHTLTTSDHL